MIKLLAVKSGKVYMFSQNPKTLTLSLSTWYTLRQKISDDYGRTTVLISWRMREHLGCTVREHRDYNDPSWREHTIRLDFWDAQLQTLFLLKYSDFLNSDSEVLEVV